VLQVPADASIVDKDNGDGGGEGNNDDDVQAQFDALYNVWKDTGDFQVLSVLLPNPTPHLPSGH
jgi:hypothetical protein